MMFSEKEGVLGKSLLGHDTMFSERESKSVFWRTGQGGSAGRTSVLR